MMDRQIVNRTLVMACIVIAIVLAFASLYLITYLNFIRPPILPVPNGVMMVTPGISGPGAYLSNHELAIFILLQLAAYATFVAGYFLNRRWGVFSDPLKTFMAKRMNKVSQAKNEE